jgi:hypothetical protein
VLWRLTLQVEIGSGRALSKPPSVLSSASPSTMTEQSTAQKFRKPVLPPYLEPVSDHLCDEDMEYLQKKGSFEIPSERFRLDLLRSYGVSLWT